VGKLTLLLVISGCLDCLLYLSSPVARGAHSLLRWQTSTTPRNSSSSFFFFFPLLLLLFFVFFISMLSLFYFIFLFSISRQILHVPLFHFYFCRHGDRLVHYLRFYNLLCTSLQPSLVFPWKSANLPDFFRIGNCAFFEDSSEFEYQELVERFSSRSNVMFKSTLSDATPALLQQFNSCTALPAFYTDTFYCVFGIIVSACLRWNPAERPSAKFLGQVCSQIKSGADEWDETELEVCTPGTPPLFISTCVGLV
jgi:hypothetical protein